MNEEEIIDGVDKDEMHLRQERVRADINRYISKKYPNLGFMRPDLRPHYVQAY